MKRIVLVLLLTFMAAFCAVPALAQFEMDDETAAVLAKEPPLTQADLDTFFKCFDAIDKAQTGEDVEKILKNAGVSAERLAYTYLKVGVTWVDAQEQPGFMLKFAGERPALVPTNDERKLLEQNMDKIKKHAESYGF